MKAKTAQAFAEHFAYLAKHYRSHIYGRKNLYDPFWDADEVASELKKLAKKNGEEDN